MKAPLLAALLMAATTAWLPAKDFDIYLAIGQSNMAGRAEVPADLSAPIQNAYLFTAEGWIPAVNPLNLHSTIRKEPSMQKLGPAYGFARKLAARKGQKPIGLVVNARGGSSIQEWLPGTLYFQEILELARDARRDGTIRGVIWHQGESDIHEAATYLDHLETFIVSLRSELRIDDLPFVAAQLSEDQEARKPFNLVILQLPDRVPFTRVVPVYGATTFDTTHFDSASQILLGERYADKMLELQKKRKTKRGFWNIFRR